MNKKILVTTMLAVTLLSSSVTAFANEVPTAGDNTQPSIEKHERGQFKGNEKYDKGNKFGLSEEMKLKVKEMRESGAERGLVKSFLEENGVQLQLKEKMNREDMSREDRQAFQEQRFEKFMEIVKEYSPESESDWNSFMDEHKNIHEQLQAITKKFPDNMKEHREGMKVFMEELKGQIKSEEITRDEAKTLIQAKKEEIKELVGENHNKEAFKTIQEAIKKIASENKINHEALKLAIENNNSDEVSTLLNKILENKEAHLELDKSKLEILNNLK